jgi:glycosyltransferase involved in cell wall biosynthesis
MQEKYDFPITIVTVVLNAADVIDITLNCILSLKKLMHFEYIVIDGKSNDGTIEILKSEDYQIDKLVIEKDGGLYHAMNKGLQQASGSHVLFLNAGDTIIPKNFASTFSNLVLDPAKGYYSDMFILIDKADGTQRKKLIRGTHRLLFWDMTLNHPTVLIPVDMARKALFNEKYKIAADYDLVVRLAHHYRLKFCKVKKILSIMAPNGISANIKQSTYERFLIQKENYGYIYASVRLFITEVKRLCSL